MKIDILYIPIVAAMFAASAAFADTASEFRSATSVAAAKKLGAQQISGASIRNIVSGNTLTNPKWTWTFRPDGTQFSDAKDGSWKTQGSWQIVGNKICRVNSESGQKRCSDVYFLGRDLKFTENGARKLAKWFASY